MKGNYDRIYEVRGKGPWTNDQPPEILVDLVKRGVIKPGRALDVGCGEGFYSKYLAEKGFDVTGIDFAELAIEKARNNAPGVDFRVMDAAQDDLTPLGQYDFCLEWSIMHCLPPEQREQYVAKIAERMNPEGLLLSTSFNDMAEKHGVPGQKERSVAGKTTLWFPSLNDVIELFKPHYEIMEANDQITLGGHQANYLLLQKK
jgi:2-polyprenyl-3-methyl-5-hydroxy-6-metoxy-1,4-benzoquinol methylase